MGCASDSDCQNGLHCDPGSTNCVPCLEDKHCGSGQVCVSASHPCAKGCSAQQSDCGDGGICDPGAKACVQCFTDTDCKDPAQPRCEPSQHRCFPCIPTMDNCAKGSYCLQQAQNYLCAAGCKDDSDCSNAPDGGQPQEMVKCDNHKCVDCKADTDCPLGKVCKTGTCTDGCSNLQGCPNQLACCAMKCVDVTLDYQNCGMCGKTCMNGWNCCNSGCSDPNNDVMNCNGCGNACKVDNGIPGCKLRQCVIAMCNPGWKNCNNDVMDGCEINTDTNIGNCGACNTPCALANASPKCLNGMCAIAGCNLGAGDCDMDPKNGCETSLFTDVNNCGACGMKCAAGNGTPKCTLGQCGIGVCVPGFGDCDKDPGNGCEVNLTNNPKHCGVCGQVCSGANGMASCSNQLCKVTCNANFGDCDGDPANGCEVNLLTDKNHCGNCVTNCNNVPANAMGSSCGGGKCVAACSASYYDLNLNYGDGCECMADATGAVCGGAKIVGQVNLGQSTTQTGNIVPLNNENWYQVTFPSNANKAYHPKIALTTNPGNAFRIDVFSNCAGGSQSCLVEGGTAGGKVSWEVYYTAGDAGTLGGPFQPIPAVGSAGVVYVRVFRAVGGVTCDNFVLTFSN